MRKGLESMGGHAALAEVGARVEAFALQRLLWRTLIVCSYGFSFVEEEPEQEGLAHNPCATQGPSGFPRKPSVCDMAVEW